MSASQTVMNQITQYTTEAGDDKDLLGHLQPLPLPMRDCSLQSSSPFFNLLWRVSRMELSPLLQ